MKTNVQKMREALEKIDTHIVSINCETTQKRVVDKCRIIAKQALAIPLRNCDVGTAEERKYRFKEYCDRHFDNIKHGCKECPARDYIEGWGVPYCQLKWAQMPYEADADLKGGV